MDLTLPSPRIPSLSTCLCFLSRSVSFSVFNELSCNQSALIVLYVCLLCVFTVKFTLCSLACLWAKHYKTITAREKYDQNLCNFISGGESECNTHFLFFFFLISVLVSSTSETYTVLSRLLYSVYPLKSVSTRNHFKMRWPSLRCVRASLFTSGSQ